MAAVWQRHQLADATCRNVASFRGPPAGPPRCRRRCRPVPPLELKVVEERATVPSRPLCPFPFIPRGTARDQTEGSCFPEEGSVSSCFVVLRDTSPVSGSLILAIFVRRQFLSLSLSRWPPFCFSSQLGLYRFYGKPQTTCLIFPIRISRKRVGFNTSAR